MKLNLNYAALALLFFIAFIFLTSCSKDSDLLSDYVINDTDNLSEFANLVVDDIFFVSMDNSTVLDVLNNDQFTDLTNVTIVGTSEPENGTVVINEDNTLTYTPPAEPVEETEEVVDTFVYTAEEVTEDGSIVAEEGTVTVGNVENRTPTSGDNVYFVSTVGKSTNDGTSEDKSWNIDYAFRNAKAGDVIWIKKGIYNNVKCIVANNGTASNPIKFIGYSDEPGDILANNQSTMKYEDYKNNGNTLNGSDMPLLKNGRVNNIGTGRAIEIGKNYIHIENLQAQHYEYGIYNRGSNCLINNFIGADMGNFNVAQSYPNNTSDAFANLSGQAIWSTGGSNNLISNCLAINNGARGIAIVSTKNSSLINSSVYCDNNINPTDYYIMIYRSESNEISNCKVFRIGDLSHFGHGISVKVDSKNNSFKNCLAEGTSFELNNRVSFNSFTDCHVQGTGKALSGGWEITNYSHDNEFINCSNDSGEGIVFSDWVESDGNNGINTAGFNNTFRNCTISNTVEHSGCIIDFHWNSQSGRLTSSARNNTFIDCKFSGADNLFKVDRVNTGNNFINCEFENIKNLRTSRYSSNTGISIGAEFQGSKLTNVGFSL